MSLANNLLNTYNNLNNGLVEQSDLITQISEALATKVSPTAKEEQEKSVEITENGTVQVLPDSGKVLSQVNITTNINIKEEQEKIINTQAYNDTSVTIEPDSGKTLSKVTVNIDVKEEQEKSVEITENGTIEVFPDTNKTLSKINIVTNIENTGIIGDYLSARNSLTTYSSDLLSIPNFAFAGTPLTEIDLPMCTQVGSSAFMYCSSLISVNLPVCTSVGASAFIYCRSLTSIDLPLCTSISGAFSNCTSLISANLPKCTQITNYAFGYCYSLTTVNLPMCTTLSGYGAFYNCNLSSITLPVCTQIGSGAFSYCQKLTKVILPVCSVIYSAAFNYCRSLMSLVLGASSVATLSNINVFGSTPMSTSSYTGTFGSIYVPASLVNAYKSATNWITYANRIAAITSDISASYTVEPIENTNYTFTLNSNNYYESNNKGENNSFAICKVNIDALIPCTMVVDCINFAENNYDYGILSLLDTELTLSSTADSQSNCAMIFKEKSMETIQSVTYTIPAGKHFIYVKFIKDVSQHTNNDSLQFSIRFE